MQPGPVEFTRAHSGDDAFEVWAADPAPQDIVVTVITADSVLALTFLLEDAVLVSYIALDGLDATRLRWHENGWSSEMGPSAACPPRHRWSPAVTLGLPRFDGPSKRLGPPVRHLRFKNEDRIVPGYLDICDMRTDAKD
jgi:hypothetical protein